jgi:MYXO-CTERM domain-containing protein
VAHFGDEQGPVARASVAGGCASPGASLWTILGLAALALVRRQRKGSISAG